MAMLCCPVTNITSMEMFYEIYGPPVIPSYTPNVNGYPTYIPKVVEIGVVHIAEKEWEKKRRKLRKKNS